MKGWKNREEFKEIFISKAKTMCQKNVPDLNKNEAYQIIARMVRDLISDDWIKTNEAYAEQNAKQVYYFSMEFLLGRLLNSNLNNLGVEEICAQGLEDLGFSLQDIIPEEDDAGLGNGGLGRLAACFIDSLASLAMPGNGCGIRYQYGLFDQKIVNGQQVELPDDWLHNGYPWEVKRADKAVDVHFGGNAYMRPTNDGDLECVYEDYATVKAIPYDVPVIGYRNSTVNTLRLWSAEYASDILHGQFNTRKNKAEQKYESNLRKISDFLYPDDSSEEGRQLRLMQEYFFVAAGVQSIVRYYKEKLRKPIRQFAKYMAIQINDTHPTLVIPELMRILMDEEKLHWDEAWKITCDTVGYTNHTVLPEALEKWSIPMVKELLPRIYLIIDEINRRWMAEVRKHYPNNDKAAESLAILWDDYMHMANLASLGSHSINGVAKIHSEILKKSVLEPFYKCFPKKFNNKTNGVTHRRWLIDANPQLAALIDETIGTKWRCEPERLEDLKAFVMDRNFLDKLHHAKRIRKEVLAAYVERTTGQKLNCDAIFDIQIKRFHMYKRQLLNIAHVFYLYQKLLANPQMDIVPHVFIFGGKAAVSYGAAKMCIRLINRVSYIINNDIRVKDKLKVLFLENYNVSLGELLFPAADVSEQISTAGKEASGTGCMKFMMNGAITLGTLDGANVEIFDRVGRENGIVFGLTAEEVAAYQTNGTYSSWEIYNKDNDVRKLMDELGQHPNFEPLYRDLLDRNDEYFVLRDFKPYCAAQEKVEALYQNQRHWLSASAVNIAESGYFSSDRTIKEYARDIWHIKSLVYNR